MTLLWSFQPLSRVAVLRGSGQLVGSWEHVPPSPGDVVRGAYEEMAAAMARAGVPTHGRPPVWAWGGGSGITVEDASMLLGDPLPVDHATVEFDAPAELLLATDYGAWNDYLAALFERSGPVPRGWDVPTPVAGQLVQVCLPVLRVEWVRRIEPLPSSPHPGAGA